MSKHVIGIDLGTGNSCVATIENGKPVIIANSEGGRTTPSVIALKDGERKVGEPAKRQRVVNPKSTVSNIKRFMGTNFDKCGDIIKNVTYDVVNRDGKPRAVVDGREYSPEELSSMILAKMKKTAEDYIGEEVTDCVITVPAWFDNAAREATKLSGELAGLTVHRIINEPTSAILQANIDTKEKSKTILVCDVGQGTTDFSVTECADGIIEVLSSKGNVFLGGSDFDNAIASWIMSSINTENGIDLSKDVQAMQRILEAAEKAKVELSTLTSSEINLPYITVKDNTPIHFVQTLTKAKMESLTNDLIAKIIECGKEAMSAAKIKNEDLDCILLVGGQTRSTAIQEALTKEFKATLNKGSNPDESVACGAAIQCDIVCGGESSSSMVLLDVTPVCIGIETQGNLMTTLIEADTTIPFKKTETFTTAIDNQTSVDINVLQGNRPLARDNKSIGVFRLDGILPARRGVPQIEVTFDIDANSILKVTAKDKATNKEQSIQIQSKSSLSKEDIERIKNEAIQFADQDKLSKEIAETINHGDSIVFQNEKMLSDIGDKVSDEDKAEITALIESMKSAVKDKNIDSINSLDKAIQDKWNTLSSKLYGAQNSGSEANMEDIFDASMGGANKSQATEKSQDNVQDADFEEVK